VNEACAKIEKNRYNYDRVIVVEGDGWHQGIIGIAASKIVEKYPKPCIVLSVDGEMAVGSGRSIPGFSLFESLCSAKNLTERFGGHELAAGVSLKVTNIAEFRKTINEFARNFEMPFLTLKLDCKLNPAAIDVNLVKALEALAPFGVGNPNPVFGLFSMRLENITPLGGGKHLKLGLSRNGSCVSALMFKVTAEQFGHEIGDTVDLAVTLEVNEYKGRESASILVKAIRKSGNDQEKTAQQIRIYESFCRGELVSKDAAQITPDRTETGILYKYIAKSKGKVTLKKAKNTLSQNLPIGKVKIAIDVLNELGIIEKSTENDVTYLLLNNAAGKVNLSDSTIIKRLNLIEEGVKDD
ncbi:MAG: DHHA1 domain-containing protein, partial [Oscillospiraceae bacterium]|nr:DHHA1 domain-containing protein [Oscillospiraceae bacterium]